MLNIKLIQGDCLDAMDKLIEDGVKVDLIVTDPPYDIKNTNAGVNSQFSKSIQGMNDEIRNAGITKGFDYITTLDKMVQLQHKINMYIWCNKAQLPLYLDYFVTQKKCSFDLIKWVKTNATPTFSNKYLSDTEYCIYVRKGGKCMPGSYEDGSTLYQAPINVKDKKLYGHPTIKPVDIIEKLIRNSSDENGIVLDPFMGSGTTCVACKKLNRNFIGIELDPWYFKIAEKRINKNQVTDFQTTIFDLI